MVSSASRPASWDTSRRAPSPRMAKARTVSWIILTAMHSGCGRVTRVTDHKASVLFEVCGSLLDGDVGQAGQILQLGYPFQPVENPRRPFSLKQRVATFVRDGFVDRYSGKRLVFPASLDLISVLLPEEFPYPPSGKMSESHVAFWELWPTIDHIAPVARGGTHNPSNWVCTSMLRNSVKSNWTLEEIGWDLMNGGRLEDWDGLMGWFLEYTRKNEKVLEDSSYLQRWRAVAEPYSI